MELDFKGAVTKETIEDVFEYLREDCAIRILPPHSRISDYIDLMNTLPEDKTRLGELLVKSGGLTRPELEEGLALQQRLKEEGGQTGAWHRTDEILASQVAGQHERAATALEQQAL